MWNPTPEQRRAAIAKGVETRKRRAVEGASWRAAATEKATRLQCEIERLERSLGELERMEVVSRVALSLCGKTLATEAEIVAAANRAGRVCGIYFLVKDSRVVYVGQSVNVYTRVASHTDKDFDSFSFVHCAKKSLNALESLYIHILRPPLNGDANHGGKAAPMSLRQLLEEM